MEYYVSLKNCMVSPRVVTVLVWRLSSYDPRVINDDTLYITQEQPLQSHEGFLFIASQSVATSIDFLVMTLAAPKSILFMISLKSIEFCLFGCLETIKRQSSNFQNTPFPCVS